MTKLLTARQLDVIRLVAEGHSSKVIAYTLGITEPTVKIHLRDIFHRTGSKNRVCAAIWATQQGIV